MASAQPGAFKKCEVPVTKERKFFFNILYGRIVILHVTNRGITEIHGEEASKEEVHNNEENKEISIYKQYKNNSGKGNKVDKL